MTWSKLSPQLRQTLLNVLRLAISVTLLAVVLRQIDFARLAESARQADLRLYGLALGLGLVGILLRAARWKTLLDAVGARNAAGAPVPFPRLVYLYFIGAFFNAFLPTGFGGDVVRVLEFGSGTDSAKAAGTTIVDRLTGFIVLFVLALAALPLAWALVPPGVLALIGGLGAAVLVGSLLLFEGRWLRTIMAFITTRLPGPLSGLGRALSLEGEGWLARTFAVITACGRAGLLRALGVSLAFNLVLLLAAWLIAQALSLPLSPATLFVFVPLATASLLLPISVSGLGVREGIYVLLFGQVGISTENALAFSFAYYSLDLLNGLAGGLLYLLGNLRRLRGG